MYEHTIFLLLENFLKTGYSVQQQLLLLQEQQQQKINDTMNEAIDKSIKIHVINHSDDLYKIISLLYCDLCSKNDGI